MLDVRYSHLYFYQSLKRLQRGLSAIAELLVYMPVNKFVSVGGGRYAVGLSTRC